MTGFGDSDHEEPAASRRSTAETWETCGLGVLAVQFICRIEMRFPATGWTLHLTTGGFTEASFRVFGVFRGFNYAFQDKSRRHIQCATVGAYSLVYAFNNLCQYWPLHDGKRDAHKLKLRCQA